MKEPLNITFLEAVAIVKESLSDEERRQILKDWPMRHERDAVIRKARSRGVAMTILAAISGLSGTSISRICKGH